MSTATWMTNSRATTTGTAAAMLDLGRVFEWWCDPSTYEPIFEETTGSGPLTDDYDDALEMRTFAL